MIMALQPKWRREHMKFADLADVEFIALETFRKNGEGVITPVWIVGEGDKLYVSTDGNSWKVKRIRNNKRVRICKSDARGKPESDWVEAQARILDAREDREKQWERISTKYAAQLQSISMPQGSESRVVVEISPL
jgi:PPOX class probable F420-dependent enzyme